MAGEKQVTVTQNDVAREAGVTRSMVSYVISGNTERSVAPETRRRILDAIERLGYRPNKAAQALQQGDVAMAQKHIGVVLCSPDVFRRPYYAEIIEGIHTAAHENGCQVRFIRFFEELKNPVLFNELIHEEEIGGLILVSTDQIIKGETDYAIIERIRERIKKIVCIEWRYEGLTSICFDRRESARKAADYLFLRGYTDVAYLGQNDARVAGVQMSLQSHGFDFSIESFYLAQAFTMAGAYDSLKSVHKKRGSLPRALVCGSDEVAMGVLCYLSEERIAVPQDVAVISIDNIEMSGYTNPPLTTINVQKRSMGSRAVELIVNGSARQGENALDITLPTNIVERKSC